MSRGQESWEERRGEEKGGDGRRRGGELRREEGGERRGREKGPTLVMGASMVMEWMRAMDEWRRCELPVDKNKPKTTNQNGLRRLNSTPSPPLPHHFLFVSLCPINT